MNEVTVERDLECRIFHCENEWIQVYDDGSIESKSRGFTIEDLINIRKIINEILKDNKNNIEQ